MMAEPLDVKVARIEERLERMASDFAEVRADTRALRDVLMQAKGGWRMIVLLSAMSAAVGGAVVKILPFLPLPR
jgi:anti-sigma-K factor RskA